MSRHRFDASLLAAHFGVEQVIGLQVEHARRLAVIDRRPPALLLTERRLVVAAIPARVQGLIDHLIGPDTWKATREQDATDQISESQVERICQRQKYTHTRTRYLSLDLFLPCSSFVC